MSQYTDVEGRKWSHLYVFSPQNTPLVVRLRRSVPAYDLVAGLTALNLCKGYIVTRVRGRKRLDVYHSGHRMDFVGAGYITCYGPGTQEHMMRIIQPIVEIILRASAGEAAPLYSDYQLSLEHDDLRRPVAPSRSVAARGGL